MTSDALIVLIPLQTVLWLSWSRSWNLKSCLMWGLVMQFFVPYSIVAAMVRWWEVPIVRRGQVEFVLSEGDWQWCLLAANISLAAIGAGYLATKTLSHPRRQAHRPLQSWRVSNRTVLRVFAVVVGSFFVWVLGISLTHGLQEHFANPLARRGGADPGQAAGFLISLGGLATISACLGLVGTAAMTWGRAAFARAALLGVIGIGLASLVLFSSGGRGAVIQFFCIGLIAAYTVRGKSVSLAVWAVIGSFAIFFAVFGHTVFNYNAWSAGIGSSLLNAVTGSIDQPEVSLQKLVTFGQSLIHPVFIRDAMASGLAPHYFRDVPALPFYLLPKVVHGVQYHTLQEEMMALYPDPNANNNLKIVTYLFWGGGWVGVLVGGASAGCVMALVDRWIARSSLHPSLAGSSIILAFSFGVGLFNGGPADIRHSLPNFIILVVLRSIVRGAIRSPDSPRATHGMAVASLQPDHGFVHQRVGADKKL